MSSRVERSSNWALTLKAQPRFRSSSRKARTRSCTTGSLGGYGIKTPIRRTRCACCARAASGHAVAPPSNPMNSRRLTRAPSFRMTRPDYQMISHRASGECCIAIASSESGQVLPVRQDQTRVSSTPNNCRTHCTAMNFRVVPRRDFMHRSKLRARVADQPRDGAGFAQDRKESRDLGPSSATNSEQGLSPRVAMSLH